MEGTIAKNEYLEKILQNFAGAKDPNTVVAFCFPGGVAKVFEEVLDKINIDEDILLKLINSIQERRDFDLVDKYYDGDLQKDIEEKNKFDGWFGEDIYEKLFKKIGINVKRKEKEKTAEDWMKKGLSLVTLIKEFANKANPTSLAYNEEEAKKISDSLNIVKWMEDFNEWQMSVDNNDDAGMSIIQGTVRNLLMVFTPNAIGNDFYKTIPGWNEAKDILEGIADTRGVK